jgi:hypothetical protein
LRSDYDSLEFDDKFRYLNHAAADGQIACIDVLLTFGADLNWMGNNILTGKPTPGLILANAAHQCPPEVVSWLLDRGAHVNVVEDGILYSPALLMAIRGDKLDTCQLLIERGALFNAVHNNRNALSVAIEWGHTDIIDYLRSVGAMTPAELEGKPEPSAQRPTSANEPVKNAAEHCRRHFLQTDSPPMMTLQEIVPTELPIGVRCCHTAGRLTIVTDGMSARPLHVPPGEERYRYAELLMYLPAWWPFDRSTLAKDSEFFWPYDWLRRTARYAHLHKTFFGSWTTVANSHPPEVLHESVGFTGLLVMDELKEWSRCVLADGKEIVYYLTYPLYTEEREFATRHELVELLVKFADRGLEMTVDPKRPNVCAPH